MPTAKDLQEYKEIDDQLVPFLQRTAEKEQEFRHEMNRDAMQLNKREQSLSHGINYAAITVSFLLVAGAMYISWDLLKSGHGLQGTILEG